MQTNSRLLLALALQLIALMMLWLSAAAWSSAATLTVIAAVIFWLLWPAQPQVSQPLRETVIAPDLTPMTSNVLELVSQVTPVWSKQSQLVKDQTEEAVLNLTEKFHQLLQMLSAEKQQQNQPQNQQLVNMIRQSEQKLLAMTALLVSAQQNRLRMLQEVQQLAKVTEALQNMTSEVGDIAAQTNLLALNAAIEAARAGESGRGFAVVATEVRALSNRSSEAGRRIKERVAEVTQALTKVVHDSEGQVEHEQQIIVQTEQTIHGVMADYENAVQVITTANQHLSEQSGYVQQQLSDVIVNLQFQDRASQIISHVIADMNKLATTASQFRQHLSMGQLPDPISVAEWLAQLEQTYTTLEQVQAHSGRQTSSSADEVTFF